MAEPSILGALRDPQFRSDTLRNLVEALNGAKRSLTVGSLGAVGDMGSTLANLVRAGAGTAYHETTGRPIPQALEYRDPARDFGTSAHLGGIAESQGWLPPQTYSMPETAGALLGPIVAMKAPDLANSTLRGLVSALKSEPSRRMVEGLVDGMGARPRAVDLDSIPSGSEADAIANGYTLKAYRGISKSKPFNDSGTVWMTTNPDAAKAYTTDVFGYDDPDVMTLMVKPNDLNKYDMRRLSDGELNALSPDEFGNPQALGIYHNSDDHTLGGSHRVTNIHAPIDRVFIPKK